MKFPFLSGLWPCGYISSKVPLFSMIKKIGLTKHGPPCYHLLNPPKNMLLYCKRSFTLAVSEIKGKQVSFKHFFKIQLQKIMILFKVKEVEKYSSHL